MGSLAHRVFESSVMVNSDTFSKSFLKSGLKSHQDAKRQICDMKIFQCSVTGKGTVDRVRKNRLQPNGQTHEQRLKNFSKNTAGSNSSKRSTSE